MGRTPIGEESRIIGICVEAQRFDSANTAFRQSCCDICFQIKLAVARLAGKKVLVCVRTKICSKASFNLVTGLRDTWPDGRTDTRWLSAQLFHRRYGCRNYAVMRPAPTGMRSAHYSCLPVSKQHRRAIRGDDAQQQPGPVGHQSVGPRSVRQRPRFPNDNNIGGVYLIGCDQLRIGHDRSNRPLAILCHSSVIIACTQPGIQASNFAGGHAALPPEESVRDTRQCGGADHINWFRCIISQGCG